MSSVAFAEAARCLGGTTRRMGFEAPTFRSPPRRPGVQRTIRRRPDGSCIVSVRIADRPLAATIADMIDGIVAANSPVQPSTTSVGELRDQLWAAASHLVANDVVANDADVANEVGPAIRGGADQPLQRGEVHRLAA